MTVILAVGTQKGAFLFRSDDGRKSWRLEGPIFKGWKVTAACQDGSGRALVAIASDVYGPAIHRTTDWKEFEPLPSGPAYDADGGRKLKQIWTLVRAGRRVYAGVDEAGLFATDDDGRTFTPFPGLNDHPTRAAWHPGFGGLCAHSVLVDPKDPGRIWCGISAVGVFRSDDGGRAWTAKNEGVPVIIPDKIHKGIGCCVHALVQDPDDAGTIYRQDHLGMFATRNGGDTWERIEDGLPSRFGFPVAMDRKTKTLYAFPLESDEYRMPPEGRFRVYRSRNGGKRWEPLAAGLPAAPTFTGVLRASLAVDGLDPCGVYAGSSGGSVYASRDGGDSWTALPGTLPRILTVHAFAEA